MARPPKPVSGKTPARSSRTTLGRTLAQELSDVLRVVREHPAAFPQGADRTRISLSLESGARLELEVTGRAWTGPSDEEDGHVCLFHELEEPTFESFFSVDDLGLAPTAKAGAQSLQAQFPNDVKFTSGRRSIERQASAMAPNVVQNRKWIEQTYKASPQRAALQKWVDDNPTATTAAAIAAGLQGVMNSWTEAQQRNFSRHITGDAFDVQPVAGAQGEKIKQAIAKLPKLNWHTFQEGGLEIWHAQFET
ncbi:hypothetical protein DZ886_002175 [Pseudomonas aeruginosa]|uniref:hypothetical protein n=1 Tax=Pseudomonas aeruginosa TaxID=287 RepID=UPI000E3151CC|nr:hypothetical protein [Pseudomonas aeruginosa]NCT77659.1 hypothetical protein [Stutzerimonas stutzeri]NQD23514.1 hypothetical protein [Pseudomonas aeruginosa]